MRRRWRLALWTAAFATLFGAAGGGFYLVANNKFYPSPPRSDFPQPTSPRQAQQQDIEYFRRLIALDRSFTPAARAAAEHSLAALASLATILDRGKFRVALLKIAALADNAHTQLYSGPGARALLLPIRVTSFSDGLYVLRAKAPNVDLLGARVIAIEGRPVEQVLTALEKLRGGTTDWRRNYAERVVVSPEYLYGLGISKSPQHSTWTFATATGAVVTRAIEAYQPDDQDPQPEGWRWMSSASLPHEPPGWLAFVPSVKRPPLAYEDIERTFRRARIDKTCVLFMQLKSNEDEEGERIADFVRASVAEIRARKPCALILDLRFNGGGDYTNTARFASRLPDTLGPASHIYLLTGPATFSAGITTIGFVKQAGGARVTILGQPVGDRLVFWAEGGRGCLPNARFCFHYSTGKHDYANACADWNDCFWLNWIFPVRVKSLQPDQIIVTSFHDFVSGRDPVFARASQLANIATRSAHLSPRRF